MISFHKPDNHSIVYALVSPHTRLAGSRLHGTTTRADAEENSTKDKTQASPPSQTDEPKQEEQDAQPTQRRTKRRADSSDFIASGVTRRFGYDTSCAQPTNRIEMLITLCCVLQIGWGADLVWHTDNLDGI